MPEYEYKIVGNAWKKNAKDGKVFLSISLKDGVTLTSDQAIFMWPNDRKRPDKQDPDWVMSVKNE